ncbi:hypothetical protein FB446DRAFT_845873 [Lentinula raphanica]|nr:hypothetical protein FB446DRAFT_845873 [Lentinula raphanica]
MSLLDRSQNNPLIRRSVKLELQLSSSTIGEPRKQPIYRPEIGRVNLEVPEQVWVLSGVEGPLSEFEPRGFDLENILIRQEYQDVLNGIIAWIEKQEAAELEMSTKQYNCTNVAVPKVGLLKASSELEKELSTVWYSPKFGDIPVVPDPCFHDRQRYPNPFINKPSIATRGALCLTGVPGIGKTLFSIFIWRLRCQLNLPTLFLFKSDYAYLWFDNAVYSVRIEEIDIILKTLLPCSTWCLIDSNEEHVRLPINTAMSGNFVIQAASPSHEQMAWERKSTCVEFLIMKPFDCSELIAGLHLQIPLVRNGVTEEMIREFYSKYGGSARDLYRNVKQSNLFEEKIFTALQSMSSHSIRIAYLSRPSDFRVPSDAGHVLTVYPLSDQDRRQYIVTSPTPFTQKRVMQRSGYNQVSACREYYDMFFRESIRAPPHGNLLDAHYHYIICRGGFWKLQKMYHPDGPHSQEFKTWKSSLNAPQTHIIVADRLLRLSILSDAPKTAQRVEPYPLPVLTIHEFDRDALVPTPLELRVYYLPRDPGFPMVDSLYTDRPGHAIVFATMPKEHGLGGSVKVRDWLEEHQVSSISYVRLTPPTVTEAEVHVPLDMAGMIDDVYHMQLEM